MIGQKMKEAIEQSGISLQKVAVALETSTSNLYILFKKDHVDTKYLEALSKLLGISISYFFDNNTDAIIKNKTKSIDNGKFGSEVEEELRTQVDILKSQLAETNRNNEFLREMMRSTLQQLNMSMSQLADSLGKEFGDEAKCLPLRPDGDEPLDIKMRA